MRWAIIKRNKIHCYLSFETYNVIQVSNVDGNPKKEKRPTKKIVSKKA
jgi:hypothetical protein